MSPLFFNLNRDFDSVVESIFGVLDILEKVVEGDSLNSFGGVYYESYMLGMVIKLERNSYAYENDFNYTLWVDKDYNSSVKITGEIEKSMLDLILSLLSINLNVEIGIEKDGELLIISPPSINI